MGAAASSLPDKLTEQDLKSLCGDSFNPVFFKALHDKSSEISRDFFVQTSEGLEKEVFELFIHFCPHGEMDSRTFVKLMKDTKSMKKKKFTATDADLIFSKHKTRQGTGVKALNYYVFRNDMVSDIVAKMGIDTEKYIEKLSRCDGPSHHGVTHAGANRFHDDKSTYTGAHAKGGPSMGNDSGQVDISNTLDRSEADVRGIVHVNGEPSKDEHHDAATMMQRVHRGKQAKKHVEALREIKHEETNIEVTFDTPKEDCDNEAKLKVLFMQFCPKGEMDSKTFIKLLRDSGVVDRKFTSGDADLVFQKTKAVASNPAAGAYSGGVVHGKRVNFDVFRAVAVPCIAEKKKVAVEKMVEFFANAEGPQMRGTTTADNVKLHDDHSTFTGTHAKA